MKVKGTASWYLWSCQASGSFAVQLYGLPMTPKDDVSVPPILMMIGPIQHKLVKCLPELLQLMFDMHSEYCVDGCSASY